MDFEKTDSGKHQELSEFQERINPQLIAHLLTVGVNLYFTYPKKSQEEVEALFRRRGKTLTIRPLKDPKETTTTFRGGPSVTIEFERPKDMSILDQYPKSLESKGLHITFSDYKLGMQLFFDYNFPLTGPNMDRQV
jgi:hypothetical protein